MVHLNQIDSKGNHKAWVVDALASDPTKVRVLTDPKPRKDYSPIRESMMFDLKERMAVLENFKSSMAEARIGSGGFAFDSVDAAFMPSIEVSELDMKDGRYTVKLDTGKKGTRWIKRVTHDRRKDLLREEQVAFEKLSKSLMGEFDKKLMAGLKSLGYKKV